MAATLSSPERIVNFIRKFSYDRHYAPSFREIADAVGLSESTVAYHLGRLRDAGEVEYAHGASRSVRIVSRG